jgi:2-polyprenyl-3-methyl-5-hydroxy-6-metoxy-1,4-benzoquinol methylase
MLARARAKFPTVRVEQIGLQEMQYQGSFDGVVCMDAMENIPPEDWPPVLTNFRRALKPQGHLYFTVEIADEHELEVVYAEGKRMGLPLVRGEFIATQTLEWALEGDYHYYPRLEQVREWLRQTSFNLLEEGEADEYHHFVTRAH